MRSHAPSSVARRGSAGAEYGPSSIWMISLEGKHFFFRSKTSTRVWNLNSYQGQGLVKKLADSQTPAGYKLNHFAPILSNEQGSVTTSG